MHTGVLCAECGIVMRPHRTGVPVIEYAYDPPQPYRIWRADLHRCKQCERVVCYGYCQKPYNHYDPEFSNELKLEEQHPEVIREFESIAACDAWSARAMHEGKM